MLANVMEWCSDYSGLYKPGSTVDPRGPVTGTKRSYRGGSYRHPQKFVRAATRKWDTEEKKWHSVGFRVAAERIATEPRRWFRDIPRS